MKFYLNRNSFFHPSDHFVRAFCRVCFYSQLSQVCTEHWHCRYYFEKICRYSSFVFISYLSFTSNIELLLISIDKSWFLYGISLIFLHIEISVWLSPAHLFMWCIQSTIAMILTSWIIFCSNMRCETRIARTSYGYNDKVTILTTFFYKNKIFSEWTRFAVIRLYLKYIILQKLKFIVYK